MAIPLTFSYRVEGVLANISPGPVTIGITRDSDGATILTSGTATTNPSTGIYSYDATALALSTSLAYSVTWTYTDESGLHIAVDTIEAADQSRTLLAYRQNVQYELGRFFVGETTSVAGEVRALVCSTLADEDAGANTYDGRYLLLTSGALLGQERRVAAGGFSNATGTFLASRSWGDEIAPAIGFEMSARLPATPMDGVRGVNYAINWALQRTWFPDRIQLTPVAGQRFYSLQAWAHWFTRDLRIGHIWKAPTDALSNPEMQRGGAWLRYDGELPMLEIEVPFGTEDTLFWLSVIRPGHTWTKSGGSWSETHTGLDADTDEALVEPNLVTQMALVNCYQQLAAASEGADRAAFRDDAAAQAIKAVRLRQAMLDSFPDGATGRSGNRRATGYPSLVMG